MADIENQMVTSENIACIFSLLKTISDEIKRPLCKSRSKVVQRKGIHLLIYRLCTSSLLIVRIMRGLSQFPADSFGVFAGLLAG